MAMRGNLHLCQFQYSASRSVHFLQHKIRAFSLCIQTCFAVIFTIVWYYLVSLHVFFSFLHFFLPLNH